MDLTDPNRYYQDDPFILDGHYPPFGIYVGRIENGIFAFRTNQTDGYGRFLWNPVDASQVNVIERLVEEFYDRL